MSTNRFWPLDYDPEGAIYENPSWDLPGFRIRKSASVKATKLPARKHRNPNRLKVL